MPASPLLKRLAIAGAALALLQACGRQEQASPSVAPAQGERLTVREADIPDLKPVAAKVTTRDMADARVRTGGTLVSLAVKAGDWVRKGQVIGVVRDERTGLETRAYDAQAAAAEAQAVRAQADLARTQDLFEHGVYAKARLDQAQAAARAAEGTLKAARAQRDASAATSAQGRILAPSDGRVLRADVPAGSVVTPGQSIATLTSGPLVIRIEAPEADARGLQVGQVLTVDEAPGQTARVVQVYPAVEDGQARADLAAPGLKPEFVGQRMTARLPVGKRPAIVIPARFVVTRFGVDYVDVLASQGQAVEVPIQLAPGPSAGEVEVLSGLNPGDVIVHARAAQ